MALSIKKQVERAQKRKDKASDAVYAAAPNNTTPFSECLKLASEQVRNEFILADMCLLRLEQEAVAQCKAWRGYRGMLYWYR